MARYRNTCRCKVSPISPKRNVRRSHQFRLFWNRKKRAQKHVVNCIVVPGAHSSEFAAWGEFAKRIDAVPVNSVIVLDAVSAQLDPTTASIKLTSLDCSGYRAIEDAEADKIREDIKNAGNATSITKERVGFSREELLQRKASVTNLAWLSVLSNLTFDVSESGSSPSINELYEVPAILVQDVRGTNEDCPDDLFYMGCKTDRRKFKDGMCPKCGGTEQQKVFLGTVAFADPTGSLEGTIGHDAISALGEPFSTSPKASDFLVRFGAAPSIIRVRIRPSGYKPGIHQIDVLSVDPAVSPDGVFAAFQSSARRIRSLSGGALLPARPADVKADRMGQVSYSSIVNMGFHARERHASLYFVVP